MRTVIRRPANHPMHLILSAFTCGLWLPVWAVCAIVGRRETVTVPDPQYFNVTAQHVSTPPPWTSGSVYVTHAGRRWHWNPWKLEWEVIP